MSRPWSGLFRCRVISQWLVTLSRYQQWKVASAICMKGVDSNSVMCSQEVVMCTQCLTSGIIPTPVYSTGWKLKNVTVRLRHLHDSDGLGIQQSVECAEFCCLAEITYAGGSVGASSAPKVASSYRNDRKLLPVPLLRGLLPSVPLLRGLLSSYILWDVSQKYETAWQQTMRDQRLFKQTSTTRSGEDEVNVYCSTKSWSLIPVSSFHVEFLHKKYE